VATRRPDRLARCTLGLWLLAAGCASVQSTAQQDRTLEAWHACEKRVPGYVRLDYVRRDGSYHYHYGSSNDRVALDACMRQHHADTSKARYSSAAPKDLVHRAYFIKQEPPAGRPGGEPGSQGEFRLDGPVTFYYTVWQSGRALQAKFKWYGPDGALAQQQDRILRDSRTPGSTRTWFVQILPSVHVRHLGRWTLEFFIEDQIVDRYSFTVVPRADARTAGYTPGI